MSLCAKQKSTEQRLEAMKWYFGERQCRDLTLASDDSDHGEFFDLNTIAKDHTEKKYVVFLDDGVAAAPSISSDQELISVSVTAGDSANDKATAIESALVTAEAVVRTMVEGDAIEIQNAIVGLVTDESVAGLSNASISVEKIGFGGSIGQTGESELTTTVELVQLLDDAQGSVVLDEIITGYSAEITIPVREMTTQNWEDLIGKVTGNTVTIDGSDITGWGTEKLYQSMFNYAGRLIGHPVRNEAENLDEDIVMVNTAPKMNSINFSGGAVQEAEFLFSAYKDASVDDGINLVARGDHTKF